MKVLIRHEESQAVCEAFLKLGHDAYSNDLQECSGNYPQRHLQMDTLKIKGGEYDFEGSHPDCTFLTNSGVSWLYNKDGSKNIKRWIELEKAIFHFSEVKRRIETTGKGYLENPIPHKYARDGFESLIDGSWVEGIGKYDQIIQPYQFGHLERKATCLWLIGIPKLSVTSDLKKQMEKLPKNKSQRLHYLPPNPERKKLRSKTYPGIAKAMAEQWGGDINAKQQSII